MVLATGIQQPPFPPCQPNGQAGQVTPVRRQGVFTQAPFHPQGIDKALDFLQRFGRHPFCT